MIMGCTSEIEDIRSLYGENNEYVVYRCRRCSKEIIFCSKESRIMDNDERGMRAMHMMISDPEFSRQCAIHSEFVSAEVRNFSLKSVEKAKDEIRVKYGLPAGFRQPDPVILLEKGLWNSKALKVSGTTKPKKSKEGSKSNGRAKPKPYPVQEGVSGESPASGSKASGKPKRDVHTDTEHLSQEEQIRRMEHRLERHVAREEYEKAAKLRDRISKLSGKK